MGHSHLNILMTQIKANKMPGLSFMIFCSCYIHFFPFAAEKPDNNTVVYYILISIAVTFTLVGLFCLYRKVPAIREKCCSSPVNVEKEDENPDYGEYHYYLIALWVCFRYYFHKTHKIHK